MGLHALERVRPDLLHLLHELVDHGWELVVFVDGDLHQLNALGLELEPVQGLTDLAEAGVREFAPLYEVALIVLPEFAAEKQHAVDALRERVGDPDKVHAAQAAHGNEPHARVDLCPADSRRVERRVGVVLAHEAGDPERVLVIGDIDGLEHGAHDVDAVVLEGHDALGAGAHTGTAAAAAVDLVERNALLILVNGTEGALFRAALAGRTLDEHRVGARDVPSPQVDRNAARNMVYGLDGLECRSGSVFLRFRHVHGLVHASRCVDSGPSRLVLKTD